MMGEFDRIEDNMKLFLKQEVARQNEEEKKYISRYVETKITPEIEDRIYKALQLEIRERLDQIAEDIVRYKNKVDELATNVQLVSRMPAEIQTLNARIEVIGGWYPYDNSQFNRKVRVPQCKTHEELLYLRKELDNIDINAVNEKIEEIEREITGVKKKLDPEDNAGNTSSGWGFRENDPNPASQLPAVRKGELKQDLAVLIKDLPLLHM
mgnify:CR=1 FL=1